jgi:hypothetical protein
VDERGDHRQRGFGGDEAGMPRAAARTLSTSSSGLVSGEAAINATIGADGVRVARMPSTIAVFPHEQNGVSVREHDRGADGCPAPLRQPAAEPVGPRYTRTAAAARRAPHAADRVIVALGPARRSRRA